MGPDARRRSENQIAVRVHPPERRRRPAAVAACGCCCCCCCLHSLGGLIAASVAGKSRTLEEQRATGTYWLCLLAALVITFVLALLGGDPMAALLIAVVLLPAYQIATSVVAAIIGVIIAGPPAVSRIWSITWRAFLGAVIGLGIMLVIVFGASEKPGALFLTILGLAVVLGFWYWIRRKRASLSPVRP